jgi:hypothetical protein
VRGENIWNQLPMTENPFYRHLSYRPALRKDCLTSIGICNKTPPFLHFPIVKGGTRTLAHLPIGSLIGIKKQKQRGALKI